MRVTPGRERALDWDDPYAFVDEEAVDLERLADRRRFGPVWAEAIWPPPPKRKKGLLERGQPRKPVVRRSWWLRPRLVMPPPLPPWDGGGRDGLEDMKERLTAWGVAVMLDHDESMLPLYNMLTDRRQVVGQLVLLGRWPI